MNSNELDLNEYPNEVCNQKDIKDYKTYIKILKDFFNTKNLTSIHLSDAKNEPSLKKIKFDGEFLQLVKKDKALQYNDIDKSFTFVNKMIITDKHKFLEELKEHTNGIIYENFYEHFKDDLERMVKEGLVKIINFEENGDKKDKKDKKILFYRNMEDDIEKLIFNNKETIEIMRKIWKNSKITDSLA